jgi:SAM-dependent methyltransferase
MTDVAEAAWGRYWAAGHLHSCPTSFDGFYGAAIQAFWRGHAERLGAGGLVLDLGCGNGGLLEFMRSCLAGAAVAAQLHGVDAAALRPGPAPAGLLLHERTRFDRLPLDTGAVSLAVSQFGFEYGAGPAAWAELFRVLRPRATVAFVAHKRGSVLDRVAADESAIAGAALAADGVLAEAIALAPYLHRASLPGGLEAVSADPAAQRARGRYNAAVEVLVNLSQLVDHGQYARDILGALANVLSALSDLPQAQTRLDQLRQGLTDHLARISELRRHALDERQAQDWRERLVGQGFAVPELRVLREGDREMGWIVEGSRDANR